MMPRKRRSRCFGEVAQQRCTRGRVGGAFRQSCWSPEGTVSGIVERGFVRWCSTIRRADKFGTTTDETQQCFWKEPDAIAYVRSQLPAQATELNGLIGSPRQKLATTFLRAAKRTAKGRMKEVVFDDDEILVLPTKTGNFTPWWRRNQPVKLMPDTDEIRQYREAAKRQYAEWDRMTKAYWKKHRRG